MSGRLATLLPPLRVGLARIRHAIGWAGLVGLALMLIAAAWLGAAYQHRPASAAHAGIDSRSAVVPPTRASKAGQEQAAVPALPGRDELPLLLTQIQQAIVSHGIAWPAADYKVTNATDGVPAALEVRCGLRGSYPQLRAAIAQLLRDVPGLTIRELTMARPGSDSVEVDARLTLAVFLREPSTPAEGKP